MDTLVPEGIEDDEKTQCYFFCLGEGNIQIQAVTNFIHHKHDCKILFVTQQSLDTYLNLSSTSQPECHCNFSLCSCLMLSFMSV
jgi:hypothetical protein